MTPTDARMNRNDCHDAIYEVFGGMLFRFEIRDVEILVESIPFNWSSSIAYDAGANYGQKRSELQQALIAARQGMQNASISFRPEWPAAVQWDGVGTDKKDRPAAAPGPARSKG